MSRSRVVVLSVSVTVAVMLPLTLTAADRFVDVPSSHVFHDDIAWLADSGVTRGCNPPENTRFCPDESVTRGQMAAFLQRLAKSQEVDAGSVEGRTASQLEATVTGFIAPEPHPGLTVFETLLGQVDLRASDGRYALVTIQGVADSVSGSNWMLWLQSNDAECDTDSQEVPGSKALSPSNPGVTGDDLPVQATFVMEVTEDVTLSLCGWANIAGIVTVDNITISVIQSHNGSLSG